MAYIDYSTIFRCFLKARLAMTLWLHIASMSTIVSASIFERGNDEISELASRSELSTNSGPSIQLNAVAIVDVFLFFIHQ